MAVGAGYNGAKVGPRIAEGVIRVTKEWLLKNAVEKTEEAEESLRGELVGESICPPTFTFNDTPTVRRILGLPATGQE